MPPLLPPLVTKFSDGRGANLNAPPLKSQGSSWRETWEKLSPKTVPLLPFEVVLHRIYRKNIPKDYHFSSKLQKTVKTSPCFKFVG